MTATPRGCSADWIQFATCAVRVSCVCSQRAWNRGPRQALKCQPRADAADSDMCHTNDRHHMMLAMAFNADLAQHHHVVIAFDFFENTRQEGSRVFVALSRILPCADDARQYVAIPRATGSPSQRISTSMAASASARVGRSVVSRLFGPLPGSCLPGSGCCHWVSSPVLLMAWGSMRLSQQYRRPVKPIWRQTRRNATI